MKPSRSANSTETWRRSATGSSVGRSGAAPSRATPQRSQNRASAATTWPFGQIRSRAEPHDAQKLAPALLPVPQLVQVLTWRA